MTEREKILARVREALKKKAPVPGGHGDALLPLFPQSSAAGARKWLPKVGKTTDEQFALFAKNANELKADFQPLNSEEEMRQALLRLSKAERWERVASHSGGLTKAICPALNLPLLSTDEPYIVEALEACSAGISECDALVAQTGSVLVSSRSAGGRALSVLPPHHVVLARREQLVADLPAAFALLKEKYADNYPSMISFITGPSRTGDIERILVLGAHGPKKLTILCF
jgi:L-lactate dehydrogenase complex protein LldG